MLGAGTLIVGGNVRRSVLSARAEVHDGAVVENSILLQGVKVGPGCVVRNAIIDKSVTVPANTQIGVDPLNDRVRGFTISEKGITVVPKAFCFAPTSA
jgi:glucose-1-phosphate adenylyltransferase